MMKNEKSESPIWSSEKIYVVQKSKYISNVTKFIDDVIFLSIHKDTPVDTTCGLNYTI